ncbi:putative binding protein component of ABC iron transporter precursor [Stieleria bergensis]|uniref:Putative binding protein component of ABC iron transporter n=1 Tax=Stieleria bergensis TaxID=2528025 RepID=A0A517T0H3_9BACT|nr:putative binding protein component of ABC iron transporter precursor [Planctomycetes bacterium SV_7m_r]
MNQRHSQFSCARLCCHAAAFPNHQNPASPVTARRPLRRLWLVVLALPLLAGCVSRSESDVVIYSALDEEFAAPILGAFERSGDHETGVIAKFDVESTKTLGLVNQIINEGQPPQCDVFWNNEILHTVRLQKLGLLQPRKWAVQSGWPADMIASDGSWCGFAARARVLIVNTKLIEDKSQFPSSLYDLADPKWKGKCAMARPLFGTTATHFAVLRSTDGEAETLKLLESIRDNAVILSGNKQVAQAVSTGQVAWGITDTDDAIIEKDFGLPVRIIFPDQQPEQMGTLRIPNTLAVLKEAPHPIAAGKLADYLVSPAIEDRLAMGDSSQLQISREAEYTPRVLPQTPVRWMKVDFEKAAEDWPSWSEKVLALFQ